MGSILYFIYTFTYNIISNEMFFLAELKSWFNVDDPNKCLTQWRFTA